MSVVVFRRFAMGMPDDRRTGSHGRRSVSLPGYGDPLGDSFAYDKHIRCARKRRAKPFREPVSRGEGGEGAGPPQSADRLGSGFKGGPWANLAILPGARPPPPGALGHPASLRSFRSRARMRIRIRTLKCRSGHPEKSRDKFGAARPGHGTPESRSVAFSAPRGESLRFPGRSARPIAAEWCASGATPERGGSSPARDEILGDRPDERETEVAIRRSPRPKVDSQLVGGTHFPCSVDEARPWVALAGDAVRRAAMRWPGNCTRPGRTDGPIRGGTSTW